MLNEVMVALSKISEEITKVETDRPDLNKQIRVMHSRIIDLMSNAVAVQKAILKGPKTPKVFE